MKMATSELGKALYELGMEIQGPYGAVTDPERGEEHGRWVIGFFMSFANTIAGGSSEIQRNIIAQRVLGLPRAEVAMDFALTADQELLRDTARQLLAAECPTDAAARAHRRPRGRRSALGAPPRVRRARRPGRWSTCACSSRSRLRRRARAVLRDGRAVRSAARGARARARCRGARRRGDRHRRARRRRRRLAGRTTTA